MKVGKAKLLRARKDLADEGTFHRGHHGRRSRKVARCRRAIETANRQAGRRECQERE